MMSSALPPPQAALPVYPDADSAPEKMAGLVARIREGSEPAMQELYDLVIQSASPYFRWRLALCGFHGDLYDRLHDTYLTAVEAIVHGTIREPERLMGFVRAVVRHQATACLRRAAHRRRTDGTEDQTELADQRPTPERASMDAEQQEMMHALLAQMKQSDRDILRRFYLDEQTQETICLRNEPHPDTIPSA